MIGRDMLAQLRRLVRPLQVRIANSIARAVVQRVDDGHKLQELQIGVLEGEPIDDAERFQEYGFSSVPLAGAEAVTVFPNGDRAHPLVVAVDDRRHRPIDKPAGHVCIYHHSGAEVWFTEDGDVVAKPAAGREVRLGSEDADDPVVRKSDLDALKAIFDDWEVAPQDGGGALFAALEDWNPSGSSKIKAD